MEQVVNNIVVGAVVPILSALAVYAVKLIKVKMAELETRIQNQKLNQYIEKAEKAIETAVGATGQTFVDSLKKSGQFTPQAVAEALENARMKAITIMGTEAVEALRELYGDAQHYLNTRIEYYVKKLK